MSPAKTVETVPENVHYVANDNGGTQIVDDAHFKKFCQVETQSGWHMLPGWRELTVAEARERNPQLFGIPDPKLVFSDDELIREAQRQKIMRELHPERFTETSQE